MNHSMLTGMGIVFVNETGVRQAGQLGVYVNEEAAAAVVAKKASVRVMA
jgi:hypothetical protein